MISAGVSFSSVETSADERVFALAIMELFVVENDLDFRVKIYEEYTDF